MSTLTELDIRDGLNQSKQKRSAKKGTNRLRSNASHEIFELVEKHSSARDALTKPDQGFTHSAPEESRTSLFNEIMHRLDRQLGVDPFDVFRKAEAFPRNPHLALIVPRKLTDRSWKKVGERIEALLGTLGVSLCQFRRIELFTTTRQAPEQALASLGIDYALDVKCHTVGEDYLFTFQLKSVIDEQVFWARQVGFDELGTTVLIRQIGWDIADQVTRAVERREMTSYPRSSLAQAHRYRLLSEQHLHRLSLAGICWARQAAVHGFNIAPNSADSAALIGRTHFLEWITTGENRDILLNEGRRWTSYATRLDPTSPRGFRELGLIEIYQEQFDAGLGALAEAERISPHDPETLVAHADALSVVGLHADAEKKIDRAILGQRSVSDTSWWTAADISYYRGRYEDAIHLIDRMVHVGPADRIRAAAYAQLGQSAKAKRCAEQFLRASPGFRVGNWIERKPFRRGEDKKHFAQGLQHAGFPM